MIFVSDYTIITRCQMLSTSLLIIIHKAYVLELIEITLELIFDLGISFQDWEDTVLYDLKIHSGNI